MLVSGYFGSTANGAAFADWLDAILPGCPQLRYCLDPVIGDTTPARTWNRAWKRSSPSACCPMPGW